MDRIAKLKAFLEQSPDDCFLNHALALEYVKLGEEESARTLFEKNLSIDNTYIATYYHFGKLLERISDIQQAIRIFEKGMTVAKAVGDMHSYSELQAAYEDLAY